jgi:hypothetical protein
VERGYQRIDRGSVVVDPTVDIGGVEVAEDFKGRGRIGLLWMALLELLQFPDLLLDLGGDRLFPFGLGLRKGGSIGLELFSDGRHGTQPWEGTRIGSVNVTLTRCGIRLWTRGKQR